MSVRPEIFLKAAEALDELDQTEYVHGCCSGLFLVYANQSEKDLFSRLFPWMNSDYKRHWGRSCNHTKKQHEMRILALLFCWAEASGDWKE